MYCLDYLYLSLATIPSILSLCIDVCGCWPDYQSSWFSRSGSLMVLFGILLEKRQHQQAKINLTNASGRESLGSITKMNTKRDKFHRIAIFISVFGTIIWGYGDIFSIYLITKIS